MRLTFEDGRPTSAVWSPDGTRIAFGIQKVGGSNILLLQVNGAGQPEMIFSADQELATDSWSADGRLILYDEQDASGKSAIWQLPLESPRKPTPVLRSDFRVRSARLSPDGRWMVYVSNESGRDEVYVQAFPGPGGKWMVSAAGAAEPSWRADGKELFFLSADHVLMAVQIDTGPWGPRVGIPRSLFHHRKAQYYDASADGTRFLVATTPEGMEPTSLDIVLDWVADLRR
jgi:Tol biopolymer transport system component